jgi:glyoxylase-like metal-dependent hydrolase (beta-lactamase superfamily II)/8-oxo-dGTP pyrophosphatase MutT (NUDIX family)
MAFAPDINVFPGGRVDPGDAEASLLARSLVTAAAAAIALGGDLEPTMALAVHVAAIRELFEEAGVLLADHAEGAATEAGAAGSAVPSRLLTAARSALVGGDSTFGAIAAELGLRLRTDLLVPLSRWVTPPIMPRRFDTRFFAAELPAGARVSFEGDEVADHAWLTPAAALDAMSEGRLAMWLPTSATLQQLEHVASIEEMRQRLSPGLLGAIEVETIAPEVTRIVMPAGGGVAGQPVNAYLVGRRQLVLIDPGDPTGPSLDRVVELAAARGGSIEAIALTHVDPDHAGGAEVFGAILGVPVLAGPGGGRSLPYSVVEVADMELLGGCDVPLQAVLAPGPRPDHLCFLLGDGVAFVIAGDLDGRRGARAVPGPMDETAAAASRERLRRLAPDCPRLGGHPASMVPG